MGFAVSVAKHHALVSGAFMLDDTLGDLGRLGSNMYVNLALIAESPGWIGVAEAFDFAAGDGFEVDVGSGANLAHQENMTGGDGCLGSDTAVWIFAQDGVDDGIGNLVADFIGVAGADGFGRERGITQTKTFLRSERKVH